MEIGSCHRSKLNRLLPLIVGFFCVIQPLLDVAAYWLRELNLSSTWTTLFRLILLLSGFAIGFAVTEHRRAYLVFGLVVLVYLTGHVLACVQTAEGYLDWVEDLTDQARTLVLPLTALSFMSFLRANRSAFPALLRAMVVNLGIILSVMVVSTLTGTDPHTYPTKGAGVRGWFIWPSPQSAILSILSPLAIAWALRRWPNRVLPVALASLASFAMLFLYGTRLGYLTVAGVGLGLAVCVFPGGKTHRLQSAGILLSAVLLLAFLPVSPMTVNRSALEENECIKQIRINQAVKAVTVSASASPNTEDPGSEAPPNTKDLTAIRAAYRYNLQGMIDRFGLERVAERYNYSLASHVICNDRIMKTRFCELLMQDISKETPLARFFGLELRRTRVNHTEVYDFYADSWELGTENYDPENDFYGILTLNGVIGFGLLAAFLMWFGLWALIAVWREHSRFTPVFAAFLGAYGIAVLYAINTASTLRRNNASVYFAWVLAGLWYLSTCPLSEGETHD